MNISNVDHYENFPVASILLPKAQRAPIAAVYAFARSADDIADEGDAAPSERLASLDTYKANLAHIEAGTLSANSGAMWQNLAKTITDYKLPVQLLADLLDAFSQDVVKTRYADYAELQDYARRSANPVGRLVLQIFNLATPDHCEQSDAICSALQFINFWQDVEVDWRKQRIYIPQEDMARFNVTEQMLSAGVVTAEFKQMMVFQVERSRALLQSGTPLGRILPGRLGWEIRATIAGGAKILHKIENVEFDMFKKRPTIKKWEWPMMLLKAI